MKVTVNNVEVEANTDETILEVARRVGIKIPTLCHMNMADYDLEHTIGSCRVCVVEVEGRPNLAPSCATPVHDGMVVKTNTLRAINARRTMLDLLLSNHPKDCLTCEKNLDCELQNLTEEMGLHSLRYTGEMVQHPIDLANKSIVRDLNKCIMCRRCETACNEIQTVGILSAVRRGFSAVVAPTAEKPLSETKCTFCGQCVEVCPTGALTEMSSKYEVWRALNDEKKTVVVQTAPAVRVAIGEEFGMEPGTVATGQLVTALKFLGFHSVFDTNFAADLTIMEEATELLERVQKNENLPILTSCCPGWVKFFEHQFPDLIHIPSSAKSPQQMFGAIAKSWYAEKLGIAPENLVVVSIMPCLAKKYEADREEFTRNGVKDVDIVLSTRELAGMIKEAGIQFSQLQESKYDDPLGESSGAADIFGVTGGVIEAALRTAADWLTGETLDKVDFQAVRGMKGIKEAEVEVAGKKLNIAVSSGLGNARVLLEKIRRKEANYHAIEIMACPGGCINGGGQPYHRHDDSVLQKRSAAVYSTDERKVIRKSHENPAIKKLYEEYLEKPGSKRAHELLHTHYTSRANV